MLKGVGLIALFTLSFQISWAQTNDIIDVENQETNVENASEISTTVETKKEKTQKVAKNDAVEKIEVTGSYIKRIDVEGPSPLVTIDKEQFQQTGSNTVADLLKESPLFESSEDDTGDRRGYFRFHGQHAGNTLVLLNGMRIPKMGAQGRDFYNGVQGIPSSVIERVEILKDGGSALYGSDAMAGVINFITKKDYDGAEFTSRIKANEQGAGFEQDYTAAFGKNFSKGNFFTTVQWQRQNRFTQEDVKSFNKKPTSPALSSSGILFQNAGDEQVELANFDQDCNGSSCRRNRLPIDELRSPRETLAAIMTGRYDVSPDINVTVLGMFNQTVRNRMRDPNTLIFRDSTVGEINLNKIGNEKLSQAVKAKSQGDLGILEYTPTGDIGLFDQITTERTYNLQSKVEGYFLDTWSWQAQGSYAIVTEDRTIRNGIVDLNKAADLIESGAFVPGQNSDLSSAQVAPSYANESRLLTTKLVTTGEVFDFSNLWGLGGPLAIAFGTETQTEESVDRNSDLALQSGLSILPVQNLQGSRQVNSGFVEVTGYPVDEIEFQVAGRFDSYSDVGDTFNPKIALGFRPSNKVLFRTSWNTNFHAPSVRNLVQPETPGIEAFEDSNCQGDSCYDLYNVTRYKDPDIGPETSTHFNFGTVVQPNKNWTFTIDQWNFKGKDTIAKLFGRRLTQWEEDLNRQGLDGAAILRDQGIDIQRDATGKLQAIRSQEIINLGERTIRGLDLGANFDHKVSLFGIPMDMRLGTSHSHFLVYKTTRLPGIIPEEQRNGLQWKNNTRIGLSTSVHSYLITARTLAGNEDRRGRTYMPTHTEYDFNYGYVASWGGTFSFGVKNILNSDPPVNLTRSTVLFGGEEENGFSGLRRRYYMGYSQTF